MNGGVNVSGATEHTLHFFNFILITLILIGSEGAGKVKE